MRRLIAAGLFGIVACGSKTGLKVERDAGLTCTELDSQAHRPRLVVFVMLDSSGSMAFGTANGTTKAAAMREALAAFYGDPASAGLGVAESFFPILKEDVPDNCIDNADCGEAEACFPISTGICLPGGKPCSSNADCQGGSCEPVGLCANDTTKGCLIQAPEAYCDSGVKCLKGGVCLNQPSCISSEYAKQVVDVATLPGAKGKLLLALDEKKADGGTPTLPALTGALAAAGAWQDSHADEKAIVLLATDGLPTACDPAITPSTEEGLEGIPAVVHAATEGVKNGVQTFVIGVFAPSEQEMAELALGQIAESGGTNHAFVVNTGGNVSSEILDAFDQIRDSAATCEYAIPWPESGGIDPLSLTISVAGKTLPRVWDSFACDGLGYYFDRNPSPGILPHRVILCPASCGSPAPKNIRIGAGCH